MASKAEIKTVTHLTPPIIGPVLGVPSTKETVVVVEGKTHPVKK